MSYKEIVVGLNDEMLEKLANDYVEDFKHKNTELRFCKALDPVELKRRHIKRSKKFNEEIDRERKKRGKIAWLSKMPYSYYMKNKHWGDSQFTYNSKIHNYPFTLKPGYELA